MKIRFLYLALLLLSFGSLQSLCDAKDTYWISYTGESRTEAISTRTAQLSHPGGPKFLMKIDVFGNILIQPTKVIPNSSRYVSPLGGGTALSHFGNGRLAMWFPHRRILSNGNHPIFKAILDKSSLRLISLSQTKLSTSNTSSISISQKAANNFIVLQVLRKDPNLHHEIIAYLVRNLTKNWFLTECTFGEDCAFAVAADGKFFLYSTINPDQTRHDIIARTLGAKGLPLGEPDLLKRGEFIFARDVTSGLPTDKRYILYGSNYSAILLQMIDSTSGQKLGNKIRIAGNVGLVSTATDPLGRFIIFATPTLSHSTLFFQALDATGHPSGTPKMLAERSGLGFDILTD